jgi:hypothetical protein
MKTLFVIAAIAVIYVIGVLVFSLIRGDKPAGFDDK